MTKKIYVYAAILLMALLLCSCGCFTTTTTPGKSPELQPLLQYELTDSPGRFDIIYVPETDCVCHVTTWNDGVSCIPCNQLPLDIANKYRRGRVSKL